VTLSEREKLSSRSRRNALVGGVLGNAFEAYDTAVYGYFAITMGKLFFPGKDPAFQVLSSLALFGVTFCMRPLGALVFGTMADRIGRTRVLIMMIVMMAAATAAVGILPTYQSIGKAATISLVILRLIQGAAVGGEFGSATSFLAEFAQPGRRGFATSWYIFSSLSGFLFGAIVVITLTDLIGADAVASAGWRGVFLLAAPLGLIALFIRLRVTETPEFTEISMRGQTSRAPLREIMSYRRPLLLTIGIGTLHSVAFYMAFSYAITYIQTVSKLGYSAAFMSTIVSSAVGLVILPIAGSASDRWGRRAVLAAGAVWILIFAFPAFRLMSLGNLFDAMVGQALLGAGVGLFLSTSTVTMAELFPTRVRATGSSVGYNIAASLFGGTAPFISALLVRVTGNASIPALYLSAAALIALVAVILIRPEWMHDDDLLPARAFDKGVVAHL
jgi:MHS family proline/betaine transporter-like MFS transporter